MAALLRFIIDLCLLRAGPQRLPSASVLMWLFVVIYCALGVAVYLSRYPLQFAISASVLETLLLAAFIQVMLKVWNKPERFVQTLTAVLAAWTLLGLLVLPLVYSMHGMEAGSRDAIYVFFGMTFYLAWNLAVMGHVLRHALEIPLYGGVGLSVLYFLISEMIMAAALPMPG